MALPAPGWAHHQSIVVTLKESGGGQIEDQAAIDLGVKREIEVVEGFFWIAKLGLFPTALQQTITAAR